MPDHVQVQTTAGSREEAAAIADALLRARAAACVQLAGPVHSRYWWKGELETAEEWLLLVKTTAAQADRAVAEIARAHTYETPEILVTPVVGGSERYLAWIDAEVASS